MGFGGRGVLAQRQPDELRGGREPGVRQPDGGRLLQPGGVLQHGGAGIRQLRAQQSARAEAGECRLLDDRRTSGSPKAMRCSSAWRCSTPRTMWNWARRTPAGEARTRRHRPASEPSRRPGKHAADSVRAEVSFLTCGPWRFAIHHRSSCWAWRGASGRRPRRPATFTKERGADSAGALPDLPSSGRSGSVFAADL